MILISEALSRQIKMGIQLLDIGQNQRKWKILLTQKSEYIFNIIGSSDKALVNQ